MHHILQSSCMHLRDEGWLNILKCHKPHQQNEEQKSVMISIDDEKALEKIHHPFLIKILHKLGIKETLKL